MWRAGWSTLALEGEGVTSFRWAIGSAEIAKGEAEAIMDILFQVFAEEVSLRSPTGGDVVATFSVLSPFRHSCLSLILSFFIESASTLHSGTGQTSLQGLVTDAPTHSR